MCPSRNRRGIQETRDPARAVRQTSVRPRVTHQHKERIRIERRGHDRRFSRSRAAKSGADRPPYPTFSFQSLRFLGRGGCGPAECYRASRRDTVRDYLKSVIIAAPNGTATNLINLQIERFDNRPPQSNVIFQGTSERLRVRAKIGLEAQPDQRLLKGLITQGRSRRLGNLIDDRPWRASRREQPQ